MRLVFIRGGLQFGPPLMNVYIQDSFPERKLPLARFTALIEMLLNSHPAINAKGKLFFFGRVCPNKKEDRGVHFLVLFSPSMLGSQS